MNPRHANHKDLKLAPGCARTTLRRDCVCLDTDRVFCSPEDGATCGIGSVQWRHTVTMRVTNLVGQDSRKFTCSTWQLCPCIMLGTICGSARSMDRAAQSMDP